MSTTETFVLSLMTLTGVGLFVRAMTGGLSMKIQTDLPEEAEEDLEEKTAAKTETASPEGQLPKEERATAMLAQKPSEEGPSETGPSTEKPAEGEPSEQEPSEKEPSTEKPAERTDGAEPPLKASQTLPTVDHYEPPGAAEEGSEGEAAPAKPSADETAAYPPQSAGDDTLRNPTADTPNPKAPVSAPSARPAKRETQSPPAREANGARASSRSPRQNELRYQLERELRERLRRDDIYVASGGQAVALDRGVVVEPAIVVARKPRFDESTPSRLLNPSVVVEVGPRGERDHLRGRPLALYRSAPSVEEILIAATDEPLIEHHRRLNDEQWLVTIRREGTLALDSVGVVFAVRELYDALHHLPSDSA